jgi:DNA modification methylase
MYKWFCPVHGKILDTFAGGSVRGVVANYLGYRYTGIDLSKNQIKSNREQAKTILKKNQPKWIVGDGMNCRSLAKGKYDFIFSCPPYGDLEVYSDDEKDLSTMSYQYFIKSYAKIIKRSVRMLKQDRFACYVVANIRDKKTGFYNPLVSDTIEAFQNAGALYYNEAILVTAIGSLPIRIGKQFKAGRKIGKTHQNILIFYKGDPKKIKENFTEIEKIKIER